VQVLVTGCAGFIGSHLSESLLSAGHSVVGVDALTEFYDPSLKIKNLERCLEYDRFRFERCFINGLDPKIVTEAELIFHLAAQPGAGSSWGVEFGTYLNLNVLSTQRLLECARGSKNLKRLVNASCSSVYGNTSADKIGEDHPKAPHSPYGVTKLAAEQLCSLYAANFGVPVISLRLFSVFGPRQRPDMLFSSLISAALAKRVFIVRGDGAQQRDFTSVLDVVDGFLLAAEAPIAAGVFNIAGEQVLSIREAIATVEELLGERVAIENRAERLGESRRNAADISAARAQLGYAPRRSLREGLQAQIEFTRSQIAKFSHAS